VREQLKLESIKLFDLTTQDNTGFTCNNSYTQSRSMTDECKTEQNSRQSRKRTAIALTPEKNNRRDHTLISMEIKIDLRGAATHASTRKSPDLEKAQRRLNGATKVQASRKKI
jgi:hypothetical protein